MVNAYARPEYFKRALEDRLRAQVGLGEDVARRRQILVFDRFLARLVADFGDAVVIKGGLVLEFRLARALTTRDIDLRLMGRPDELLMRLRRAARSDLGDYLSFEVKPDTHHPTIDNEGMQYEGMRFRAECRLASKRYAESFGVDVAFGDLMCGEADVVCAADTLGFAGIAPPCVRLLPINTHVAEKLHAYRMPRPRPNSRVRDLPNIALLANAQPWDARALRTALTQVFAFCTTHDLPEALPMPWRA